MPLMEVKDITFTYPDGTLALNKINMTFEKSKTTTIIGENGAGKSTLFKIINGILAPESGSLYFKDKKMTYSRKDIKELRKSVGIVFQDPDIQLFSASVYKDISFGPMNMNLPIDEVRNRVEKAIIDTDIGHIRDKPTHFLSYGQKKRVAIAGVLAMQPSLIILDEPTAGLDPKGVTEILGILKKLQEDESMSIIIATHDIDIVPEYSDYIYAMKDGQIKLKGRPEEFFKNVDLIYDLNLRAPIINELMRGLVEDGFTFLNIENTVEGARKEFGSLLNKKI